MATKKQEGIRAIPVVEKARYDALLMRYFKAQKDKERLRKLVDELKDRITNTFSTLEEERAYLEGAFIATKAIEWDIIELGGKYDVQISK